MPIMPCQKNGKNGVKYGKSGTCYIGLGARKKAAKQAAAIHHARTKRKVGK